MPLQLQSHQVQARIFVTLEQQIITRVNNQMECYDH